MFTKSRLLLKSTALALIAGGVAVGGGCSYSTNETAVQCTSEKECIERGPEFANTTCSPVTKTCVPTSPREGLCSTNQDCITRFGGSAAICRKSDSKCVVLQTPECPTVMGKQTEIANDNAVIIGALTPANDSELGAVMERAVALAQLDFSTANGLPQIEGQQGTRPLVVVSCNEFGAGVEGLIRAGNHLVRNVGVPAIIGPVDPANVLQLATQVTLPNRVFSIAPTAIQSGLADLPNPIAPTPLIWRTNFSDAAVAALLTEFVAKVLEPRVVASGVLQPGEKVRVALVSEGNVFGLSLGKKIQDRLVFNGVSATENSTANPPNFAALNFGDQRDPVNNPNPDARIAQTLAAIFAFKPHIILHSSALIGMPKVYFPLETLWPAGVPRPIHVGATPPWASFGPIFQFMAGAPPQQRTKRIYAITNRTAGLDQAAITEWVLRFKQQFVEFSASPTPQNSLVHLLYDATYATAYAIAATGSKPLTGENLAGSMGKLVPPSSQAIRTQPADIAKALGTLSSGQSIDLSGLFGDMNFDLQNGGTLYDVEIACPSLTNGVPTTFKPSGFYFDKNLGSGTGTLTDCP